MRFECIIDFVWRYDFFYCFEDYEVMFSMGFLIKKEGRLLLFFLIVNLNGILIIWLEYFFIFNIFCFRGFKK